MAHGRSERNKKKIIEWLEEVSSDLDELSDVWLKFSIAVETDQTTDWYTFERTISSTIPRYAFQGVIYSRLRRFYDSASVVLGDKVNSSFRDTFLDQLETVLYHRDVARAHVDQHLSRRVVLASSNQGSEIQKLRDATESLQKEAAALHVLISNFKAMR